MSDDPVYDPAADEDESEDDADDFDDDDELPDDLDPDDIPEKFEGPEGRDEEIPADFQEEPPEGGWAE